MILEQAPNPSGWALRIWPLSGAGGPCRAVAPTVEAIAQEFSGKLKVVKLNTDEEQEITIKYGVGSIPTLMVFKNGEMVERIMGNRPKAELAALVSRYV